MIQRPLPPNSTLGVFGGGQLGRMFAMAAARLGYRVSVYSPESDCPAAHVSANLVCADYTDEAAVRRFADSVDAVTYEFENVPADTLRWISDRVPACPQPEILHICRNRIREKTFLRDHGIPVTPFESVASAADLEAAARRLGGAVITKTVELGYDGKGQARYDATQPSSAVWSALGNPATAIAEQVIELEKEYSILVARDASGTTAFHGPCENTHQHHILDTTVWQATDSSPVASQLRELAAAVAHAFDLIGMICVECFLSRTGDLMINEIAPRPHNSGHLSIEAESISQFEQQVRMAAGWSVVAPQPRAPAAAMANLLGDLWAHGEPDWQTILQDPHVGLHLYGKSVARPGRKMGHITALADTPADALRRVCGARHRLAVQEE